MLGWGPGSTQTLLRSSGRPELQDYSGKYFEHLHNGYLELLVRLGLVGAVFMTLLLTVLIHTLRKAYRCGRLPLDYALVVGGGFAITAVWSVFDFRVIYHDWNVLWTIMAASVYTFGWRSRSV